MSSVFQKDINQLENKGSIQRKLGIKISKSGYVSVPLILLKYFKKMGLTFADFWFICFILSKKRDSEWPYFSLNKATRELGISQDTLHKAKKRLIGKHFLRTYRRKENSKGKGRNIYDLSGLFSILNKYIEKDHGKFLKSDKWSFDDFVEFGFIEQIEKEKLSEMRRDTSV